MAYTITGKGKESPKGHYVVEKSHQHPLEQKVARLEQKLDKHMHLPMEKAHHPGADQSQAPLPNMWKY